MNEFKRKTQDEISIQLDEELNALEFNGFSTAACFSSAACGGSCASTASSVSSHGG